MACTDLDSATGRDRHAVDERSKWSCMGLSVEHQAGQLHSDGDALLRCPGGETSRHHCKRRDKQAQAERAQHCTTASRSKGQCNISVVSQLLHEQFLAAQEGNPIIARERAWVQLAGGSQVVVLQPWLKTKKGSWEHSELPPPSLR